MSASVLSLTKRLSGTQWREVYEILLDLNGKHRAKHDKDYAHKTGSALLLKYAFDLRLIGDARSAENLETLTTKSSDDDPTLLLLALLSDVPKPAPSFGSRVFPMNNTISEKRKVTAQAAFAFLNLHAFRQIGQHEVSELEDSDVILTAARNLLDHKRNMQSGTHTQGKNLETMPRGHIKKLAPIRPLAAIEELSYISDQLLFKPSRYPESLQNFLHLLLNGSPVTVHVKNIETVPNSAKIFRGAQDSKQMHARRGLHVSDCASCSKRRSGYTIEDTFPNSIILNISDVNKELYKRAEACGRLYENLACFSTSYYNSSGRVLSAVAGFVHSLAQDYLLQILDVVKDDDHDFDSAQLTVIFAAERHKEDMLAVVKLLSLIEYSSGSACAVLNILYSALQKSQSAQVVHELFYVAFSPYVEMIWDWGFYASSARDYGIEYFGTILGRKVTDSEALMYSDETKANTSVAALVPNFMCKDVALFILRAGRSRGLLEMIIPNHDVLNLQPPDISVPFSANHVNGGAFELSDCVKRSSAQQSLACNSQSMKTCESNESCDNRRYRCDYSVEDVSRLKEIAFVAPKDRHDQSAQTYTHNAFPFSELRRNRYVHDLNSKHVQVGSSSAPKTLVEQRIVGILRRIDISIQREILTYFVEKIRVFDHLKVIGDLALLGAGDFAVILVQQLCEAEVISKEHERFIKQRVIAARTFYGSTGPGGFAFRKRRHLAACLRAALNAANTSHNDLPDNFHISIENGDINQSSLWEGLLKVEYEASFPLSMIISPEALSLYSKYFNFFLSLGRAQRCLRSLFLKTRSSKILRGSHKTRGSSVLSDRVLRVRLWQFCWHAEHFVSIVGGYEFDQIHGISRTKFESSWKDVSSIWELRDSHMSYLNDSIRRVLLGDRQKSIMRVIAGALKIIIEVEEQIGDLMKSGERHSKQNVERLLILINASTSGIKRRSIFLVDVLEKLVATGSHPHLQDFVTRLNFNFYYKRDTVY